MYKDTLKGAGYLAAMLCALALVVVGLGHEKAHTTRARRKEALRTLRPTRAAALECDKVNFNALSRAQKNKHCENCFDTFWCQGERSKVRLRPDPTYYDKWRDN